MLIVDSVALTFSDDFWTPLAQDEAEVFVIILSWSVTDMELLKKCVISKGTKFLKFHHYVRIACYCWYRVPNLLHESSRAPLRPYCNSGKKCMSLIFSFLKKNSGIPLLCTCVKSQISWNWYFVGWQKILYRLVETWHSPKGLKYFLKKFIFFRFPPPCILFINMALYPMRPFMVVCTRHSIGVLKLLLDWLLDTHPWWSIWWLIYLFGR